jgi:tetratricopeptide (TPR) repeat protein
VTHVGRNDRCPCGSGKKYKKCCLPEQEKNARIAMRAEQQRALEHTLLESVFERGPCADNEHVPQDMGVLPPGVDGYALDALSNGVLDLINQRRLDDALAGCKRLLVDYPDVPDGLEMSAMAHDVLGNHAVAADFWQKLLDFAEDPGRRRHYSDELIEEWRASRDRSRNRAAEDQPARVADSDRAP